MSKKVKIKLNKKENAIEIQGIKKGQEVEKIKDVLSTLQSLFKSRKNKL